MSDLAKLTLTIVLLGSAIMPTHVRAQIDTSDIFCQTCVNGYNYGLAAQGAINAHITHDILSRSIEDRKDSEPIPRNGMTRLSQSTFPGSASSLIFTRSYAVSAQVRESIISSLIKREPSLQRAQLERAFGGNKVVKAFDRVLANFGYSGTHLIDVLTVYIIISWEIVNHGDVANNNERGIRATHDRLLQAALHNRKLITASDSEKQRFAEALAYQTMLTTAAVTKARRTGNEAALQQLRGQVRTAAMQIGPDPYTLKLTDEGLVPKS
jgi:hypothetical protein